MSDQLSLITAVNIEWYLRVAIAYLRSDTKLVVSSWTYRVSGPTSIP